MFVILPPSPLTYPVHTRELIQRESGILFISILAVSAKFSRPTLYPLLLAHAQAVLSRAIIAGDCHLSIVQALLVIIHWKAPTDKSAWVKLGIAIRLSYQLDLHVMRKGPLPSDEMAARRVRAAERTWLGGFLSQAHWEKSNHQSCHVRTLLDQAEGIVLTCHAGIDRAHV